MAKVWCLLKCASVKAKNLVGLKRALPRQNNIKLPQHAYYLQQYGNQACRFDVILMDKVDARHIDWIKNAFEA
jgi:Holliday junction resolvase-like predicted endonuclease